MCWYKRNMASFALHGLWSGESGLHLWIEQRKTNRGVTPDQLSEGTFPPCVEQVLQHMDFRTWLEVALRSPAGSLEKVRLPAASIAGEQLVQVFDQLAVLDREDDAVRPLRRGSIASDLRWLLRFYLGVKRFVSAGQVTLSLRPDQGKWWPRWGLAAEGRQQYWVRAMVESAPGVLVVNGGEHFAETFALAAAHWITLSKLRGLAEARPAGAWHPFSRSLLYNLPVPAGSEQFVSAIKEWRESTSESVCEIVVVVAEEPVGEDADELLWPVRLRISYDGNASRPLRAAELVGSAVHYASANRDRIMMLGGLPQRCAEYRMFGVDVEGEAGGDVGDWDCYLTLEELQEFLSVGVPRLRAAGVVVLLPKSWTKAELRASLELASSSDPTVATALVKTGVEQILGFRWRISLDDKDVGPEEMRQLVASKAGLVKLRDRWVLADTDTVRRVAQYMDRLASQTQSWKAAECARLEAELQRDVECNSDNVVELQGRLAQLRGELDAAQEAWQQYNRQFDGETSLAALRSFAAITEEDGPSYIGNPWHVALAGGADDNTVLPAPTRVAIPKSVRAELREYQRRGVDWLLWMSEQQVGAVLADDMGLGKTLQVLTMLAVERERGSSIEQEFDISAPSLVIAPTSVVSNWAAEANRFTPDCRVMVFHGSDRPDAEAFALAVQQVDLVVTSYGLLTREFDVLAGVQWGHVILDEAQQIKNSTTKVAKASRGLPARHRIALTGTPMENRLSELRSILDFCNPGILGTASFFRNHFVKAIERYGDELRAEQLRRLTAPFILRRLKTDRAMIADLPEKNEEIVRVHLTKEQVSLYQALVERMAQEISGAEGINRKGLVLATITRIKQICNHPAHYLGDGSPMLVGGKHRSGKVRALADIIARAHEADERVLVFTQYRVFGGMLQDFLEGRLGTPVPFLHGGVSRAQRDRMIESFQGAGGPSVMVLSLKAGGTGLNLTKANVVVHMDRWWNPAVENQATDRAFRIGQRRDVRVYKMMALGTLEEAIQDVLDGKLQLAESVIRPGEGWITELSPEDLTQLLSYRGRGVDS